MRLTFLSLLILPLALSAAAAERPLSPVAYGPAPSTQAGAVIATDGDGYLVMWTDLRASRSELWGTRVAHDGSVLDPTGLYIAPFVEDGFHPIVAWTGTCYLVVWQVGNPWAMWARRISRDGTFLDDAHLLLADALPSSVVSNGSHVAIGYSKFASGSGEAHALILTPDGIVLRDILLASPQASRPTLAWNGSRFAAAWTNAHRTPATVEVIRFTAQAPVDAAPRVLPEDTFAFAPRIASDGNSFVILSSRDNLTSFLNSHSVRALSADLASVGPVTVMPAFFNASSILWLGGEYAVFGERAEFPPISLGAIRLDRAGHLIDGNPIAIESLQFSGTFPAVAANGRDLFAAWNGASNASNDAGIDVFGTLIDGLTLRKEARVQLSASAKKQRFPVIASGGTNLLAVWSEDTGLYAKRLALDGTPIDAEPLRLYGLPAGAAVVFNGTDYIVAWFQSADSRVVTRRIARDGLLRADGGGQISASPSNTIFTLEDARLALASDGTTTLLALPIYMQLTVVRLEADGAISDSPASTLPPLVLAEAPVGRVTMAPDDRGNFLVVWQENSFICLPVCRPTPLRVRGARVTSSLVNLDPAGLPISEAWMSRDPLVAWNGREWLVVWQVDELPNNPDAAGIRGRRISRDGLFLDTGAGVTVSTSTGRLATQLLWNGTRYAIAWNENHDSTQREPWQTHIAWLSQLGPLFGERVLGEAERNTPPISLVPYGRDGVLALYARVAREPQYGGVTRAFTNVLSPELPKRRAVR